MPNFLINKNKPTDIDKLRNLSNFDNKEKINKHVISVSKTNYFIEQIESSLDDPKENETEDEYVLRVKEKISILLLNRVGF